MLPAMGREIERKFLVTDDFVVPEGGTQMVQGYLAVSTELTVRVRRAGDEGFLTIKGKTVGISRLEYEYRIPVCDAEEMLALCAGGLVAKTRHEVPSGAHVFEVDVFSGENTGLVMAELELASEDEPFERPAWLGEEVSYDRRYTNSALARCPFQTWKR